MSAITPIRDVDLDFDHGTFDSAAFAAQSFSSWQSLASVFDHSLLAADATREQIENLCGEAVRYRFASVVVNPIWAATAVNILAGTGIPAAVVIGFPLGASLVSTLRQESAALMRLGARELKMVIPIGLLKSGNHQALQHTIHAALNIARHHGAGLTVILETCLLNTAEKLRAAEVAIQARAHFISTSSGFSTGGATAADVALLRGVAGGRCGVQACGGIRTLAQVRALLEAGANRIDSPASVAIMREFGAE